MSEKQFVNVANMGTETNRPIEGRIFDPTVNGIFLLCREFRDAEGPVRLPGRVPEDNQLRRGRVFHSVPDERPAEELVASGQHEGKHWIRPFQLRNENEGK